MSDLIPIENIKDAIDDMEYDLKWYVKENQENALNGDEKRWEKFRNIISTYEECILIVKKRTGIIK